MIKNLQNLQQNEQTSKLQNVKKGSVDKSSQKTKESTPHIDLISIRETKQNQDPNSIRNFNSFMKQIIESKNDRISTPHEHGFYITCK